MIPHVQPAEPPEGPLRRSDVLVVLGRGQGRRRQPAEAAALAGRGVPVQVQEKKTNFLSSSPAMFNYGIVYMHDACSKKGGFFPPLSLRDAQKERK